MVGDAEGFQFEKCLLKHHVRVNGWLPRCAARLKAVRKQKPRRLRYFTFCAIGAVDVFMLNIANIVRMSDKRKFDNVVFFDKDSDAVNETLKRIPGSVGFNGKFTDIVLLDPHAIEAVGADNLTSDTKDEDTVETRTTQRERQQHSDFIAQFPFDIINLDLEEFLFKDHDPTPGKVINSIRKIFEWQRRPLKVKGHPEQRLEAFSFMFTTQVGPAQLADDHRNTLVNCLTENLAQLADLPQLLQTRTGVATSGELLAQNFEIFFKIAVPKAVAKLGLGEDWYVDPASGVQVFEFTRDAANGPYKMLHLVMDFVKPVPDRDHRVGDMPLQARNAYGEAVRLIIATESIPVTPETIDEATLRESLNKIFRKRKRSYPEEILVVV
jgi:hypothetical protein